MHKIERLSIVLFLVGIMLLSPQSILAQDMSLDEGLNTIADQISESVISEKIRTVAVMDFNDLQGNVTLLGRFIEEELVTRLFQANQFKVIERSLLEKALEELKFNLSDLVDPSVAKQLGKMVGADAIVTGTITDLGQSIKINARIIAVESGEVIGASGAKVVKDASVGEMLKKMIGKPAKSEHKETEKHERYKAGSNLIINGDFRNRYEGWERIVGDEGKGSSKTEITGYSNSRSGQGLHITHTGGGYIQFYQTVDVDNTDIVFSATFQAKSKEGPFIAFSGTGMSRITLQYMGENESVLGQTSFVNYVKNPFADSPLAGVPRLKGDTYKSHDIIIENNRVYRNYSIDIRKELEDNLIGMNPKDIKKITVAIWCTATHKQASTELWISDISLSYK